MQPSRTRRVYLLDSHEIFRKGVRSVLDEAHGVQVVGESGSFAHAREEIGDLAPHVAIVGIRENERASLEELRPLRREHPATQILVLARADHDDDLTAALRLGATGYLSKEVPAAQLLSAVTSVAAGRDVIDRTRAMRLVSRERAGTQQTDPLAALTAQERKILALIAQGMTNRQIAEQLFLVEKTVRNHVTRILAKLGVERRTQAALIAVRLLQSSPAR